MRTYGGKTLQERRAERRGRLLDAGLELFGTQGYAQSTIEQICAAARLNPRYFYEEFETREALLGAVYERHVRAVAERVRSAIEAAPRDPRARLETGLRAFLDGSLADERAARVNYFEVVGVSPALEGLRRRILGEYAELIAGKLRDLAGESPLAGEEARLIAVALAGATDGLVIDWLSGERSYDREAITATLLDVFGAALSG